MLALLALLLASPSPDAPRREAAPPRLDAEVVVDGRLDEAAWDGAAVLDGFTGYLPVDGAPAEDATEVRVWYAPDALYLGVRATEAHGEPRATLADRDRIEGEDHVQFVLDTFGDGQRAYVLAVNALGVQADGVRTETSTTYQPQPGFGNVDLSPDLVFESAGGVRPWGYEVEVRVPFTSLRYGRGPWGLNVLRQTQHAGRLDAWAPVRRSVPSFLAQTGALVGLDGIARGLALDLNPVLTSTLDGAPTADGWRYERSAELGGNVRWGITPDLTLNATVLPDFSQVEADAGQVPGDARFALLFPEKRPFFVDGSELFEVPGQLVYTRSIVAPVAAAKVGGTVGGTSVGLLSAVEDAALSADGETTPLFQVVRVRHALGGQTALGATVTDRTEGSHFSRMLEADARTALPGGWRFSLQGAGSLVHDEAGSRAAPFWAGSVGWDRRTVGARQLLLGIHRDFEAAAGFIQRSNLVRSNTTVRLSHFGAPGQTLQSWQGRVVADGVWAYDRVAEGGAPLETKLWLENTLVLRGGWDVVLTAMQETFAFDPRDYAAFRVAGPDGAVVPFEPMPRQYTGGLYVTLASPRFAHLSVDAFGFVGLDPDFEETVAARRLDLGATVGWRPSDRVRVDASVAHSEFVRRRDGTLASALDLPRLKVEYQLTRALFLRWVGEVTASRRDAPRDPRTDGPLLVVGPDGTAVPVGERQTNELRTDWLLSYRPTPGTTVFLGYGSTLAQPGPGGEPGRFDVRDLDRQRDGLFLKLSYTFRP